MDDLQHFPNLLWEVGVCHLLLYHYGLILFEGTGLPSLSPAEAEFIQGSIVTRTKDHGSRTVLYPSAAGTQLCQATKVLPHAKALDLSKAIVFPAPLNLYVACAS